MYIESLELRHFRNYDDLSLQFDRGTNLFWGSNAQGKTNILEALYLGGTTRSHRTAKDKDMIKLGQAESHIRMTLCKNDVEGRIDMHLKKQKAKGIAINGIPIRKASELFGLVSMVFFSPEDLNMIKNGPSERRRFIDRELSQLDRIYLTDLVRYQKCLMQRNKLLHEIYFRPDLIDELDVWDDQLISYGEKVVRGREAFLEELNEIVSGIHSHLTGQRETIRLIYEPSVSEGDLGDRIRRMRESDLKTQSTGAGPHRDDMCVEINGMDARVYGSQGQQRTAALSLKMSEIELVRKRIHDTPVLLLDDVLSELDESRQDFLLDSIRDIQTFITCTGIDEITRGQFKIDRSFYVEDGRVAADMKAD